MAIWSGRSILSVLAWAVHDEPLTRTTRGDGRKTWPLRLSYQLEPEDDSLDTDDMSETEEDFYLKYPISLSLFIADPQLVAVSPRTALSSGRNLTPFPLKCGPKLR
ncbi:hypothetical protein B0H16DRAFT_1518550, partial [Mycena metata]